jgi:hypothetical protein
MNNHLSCMSCLLDRHSLLATASLWLIIFSVFSVDSVVKNGDVA